MRRAYPRGRGRGSAARRRAARARRQPRRTTAISFTPLDETKLYCGLAMTYSVSMSGASVRFRWFIWNSHSKSEIARSPLTIVFAPCLRANSTTSSANTSTSTFVTCSRERLLEKRDALLDGEHRSLVLRIADDADDDAVEDLRRPADDVDVAVRDRVVAARADRDDRRRRSWRVEHGQLRRAVASRRCARASGSSGSHARRRLEDDAAAVGEHALADVRRVGMPRVQPSRRAGRRARRRSARPPSPRYRVTSGADDAALQPELVEVPLDRSDSGADRTRRTSRSRRLATALRGRAPRSPRRGRAPVLLPPSRGARRPPPARGPTSAACRALSARRSSRPCASPPTILTAQARVDGSSPKSASISSFSGPS